MVRFVRNWFCTCLYTLFILCISLAPLWEDMPMQDVPFMDKWVHFVMYALVSVSAALDVIRRNVCGLATTRVAVLLFIYAVCLGGVMELLQGLTDYRSADWMDFLANCVGTVLGSGFFLVFFRFRAPRT